MKVTITGYKLIDEFALTPTIMLAKQKDYPLLSYSVGFVFLWFVGLINFIVVREELMK